MVMSVRLDYCGDWREKEKTGGRGYEDGGDGMGSVNKRRRTEGQTSEEATLVSSWTTNLSTLSWKY